MSSTEAYLTIHRLLAQLPLAQLPPRQVVEVPSRRSQRRGPRIKLNGIYFTYERGEVFADNGVTYERIVRVGINEKEGQLLRRLASHSYADASGSAPDNSYYGHSSFDMYIRDALARKKGVEPRQISDSETYNYKRDNLTYRVVRLPSAEAAKSWEQKIIPTLAEFSLQFATADWLGRSYGRLRYGLWNYEYTSEKWWRNRLSAGDLQEFAALVNQQAL